MLSPPQFDRLMQMLVPGVGWSDQWLEDLQ